MKLVYPESLQGAIPGTVEVLRRLRVTGYPLFGLSNWPAEKFALVRPHYEFFSWFQGIVISGEVGVAKPDLRIYRVLLAQVGRPPEDCLLIDDSPASIAAARSLGFQAILFREPAQLADELAYRGLLPEGQ